jgi:hypothetical protein
MLEFLLLYFLNIKKVYNQKLNSSRKILEPFNQFDKLAKERKNKLTNREIKYRYFLEILIKLNK